MVDKSEVIHINGIYTSQLYANWYAAEFLVMRGGRVFRIRFPYNTRDRAQHMIEYLHGRMPTYNAPDYRPIIHIMERGYVK